MTAPDVVERVVGSDGKTYPASYVAHREAIRVAIEADPKATNTAIAKRMKASRDTVIDVRRNMTAAAPREFARVPISDICIGERHRKDHGDIEALAENIREIGLLHPPVVTPDLELIAGERRLMACARLEWPDVPVRIVSLQSAILGEYAENEFRKDFTVSERVAIGLAIEAQIGKRQGARTDIEQGELPPNLAEVDAGRESRDVAAERAGFGGRENYRKAKEVVMQGTPELIEAMDAGRASIHAAAAIATVPEDEQREIVAHGEGEILQAAKKIRARARDQTRETAKEIAQSMIVGSDTEPDTHPPETKPNDVLAYEIQTALELFSGVPVDPAKLHTIMPDYQWYRVEQNIDGAIEYLNAVKKLWRTQ